MITTITENDMDQASENLDRAESRYRAAQEHLTATHDQFQRNRKTLELAQQEADNLNREWKQLLRDANGKTNKAVMEKLEASRNARDIADELEPILESTPEILKSREAEVILARKEYLRALEEAKEKFLSYYLAEAAEKVQDTPEFIGFLVVLSQYISNKREAYTNEVHWELTGHPKGQGGALWAEDRKVLEAAVKNKTQDHLMQVMRSVGLDDHEDPNRGFPVILETEQERNSKLKGSPIRIHRAL